MPQIDARRLVSEFEGPAHLKRRLERDGYHVSLKTVERWITRGRVPGDWLVILSAYAWQDGRQLRLHDYIVSEEDVAVLLPGRAPSDTDFLD